MPSISEAFLRYRTDRILSDNGALKTNESYLNAGKLASGFFGDIDITELTHEKVIAFKQYLLSWQAPDTMRGNIICLRMVLKYMNKLGLPAFHWEGISVPKRQKRKIKWLADDEVEELIQVINRKTRGYKTITRIRNVAMARLLFDSGIRVSELCKLDRYDIRNNEFIAIGKSKDPRPCFVTDKTMQAIEEYLALRTDSNRAMFVSHQNDCERVNPTGVQRVFISAREYSGDPRFDKVTPHTLRHSNATSLLNQEVDIRYIGDLLGHASLETTRMYTHYKNPKLKLIHQQAMLRAQGY